MASPAQQLLTLLPLLLGLAAAAAAAGADDDDCNRAGRCVGQIIATEDNILSAQQCLTRCKRAESCSWYNYDSVTRKCEHLSSCFRSSAHAAEHFISGRSTCQVTGPVSPFLLGHEEFTVVDVLNPDATFDCKIPYYPLTVEYTGVATYLKDPDRVLVCGGSLGETVYEECFVLRNGNWEASDIRLPKDLTLRDGLHEIFILRNKYWFLSTFYSYSTVKVQDLVEWLPGPDGWHPISCSMMLDETHTLNVGGGGVWREAFVYDWETKEKTETEQLLNEYDCPGCLSDGKGGGWVIGNSDPTLEHYNPETNGWTNLKKAPESFKYGHHSHFFLNAEGNPTLILLGDDRENYYVYSLENDEWSAHKLGVQTNTEFLGVSIPPSSDLLKNCVLLD